MLSDVSFVPSHIQNAVVLLHGYGANGQDLIDLANFWKYLLPHTAFFAPNAPHELEPNSFEWFSLNDYNPDKTLTNEYALILQNRAKQAIPLVQEYINTLCQTHHLNLNQIVLGGFSQGGLMSFLTAFSAQKPLAGVMGLSAVPIVEPVLTSFQTPVLLTHGTADFVVPVAAMEKSKETLEKMNQSVETFTVPYMGHGIDESCIDRIGQFLKTVLK